MTKRLLILDSRGSSGPDRARSRGEALEQMAINEYDAIELRTSVPGRDEYGLIPYLAATWPAYLQQLTLRTVTPGSPAAEWSHEQSRFILARRPPRAARRRSEVEVSAARAVAR